MYSLFWHNRFADSMRTCYSLEECKDLVEVAYHLNRFRSWEQEYQPHVVKLFKSGSQLHHREMLATFEEDYPDWYVVRFSCPTCGHAWDADIRDKEGLTKICPECRRGVGSRW